MACYVLSAGGLPARETFLSNVFTHVYQCAPKYFRTYRNLTFSMVFIRASVKSTTYFRSLGAKHMNTRKLSFWMVLLATVVFLLQISTKATAQDEGQDQNQDQVQGQNQDQNQGQNQDQNQTRTKVRTRIPLRILRAASRA